MTVPEAELARTENGLVPKGQGWFVLNAREAQWWERPGRGVLCEFEGAGFEGAADFEQLGINVTVLAPGEPMSMYHRENDQEDFLVLDGEAVAIVEGEERLLRCRDEPRCRRRRRPTVRHPRRRSPRPLDGAGLGRLHGRRGRAAARCRRRAR